jgi:hypothetical protein
MTDEKPEWEIRMEEAAETWEGFSDHQQRCVLELLKAWVPVRTRVGELCSIDYDDLKAIDTAWWKLKNAIVDNKVQINEWDY